MCLSYHGLHRCSLAGLITDDSILNLYGLCRGLELFDNGLVLASVRCGIRMDEIRKLDASRSARLAGTLDLFDLDAVRCYA